MIKRIAEKANKLKTMYVQEGKSCYWISFHNTHKLVGTFKTQRDLEEKLDEILESGQQQGSYVFY